MVTTHTAMPEGGVAAGAETVPRQRTPAGLDEPGDAAGLRDRLTRLTLRAVPESPAESDVVRFRRRWWDGAAYVPSVVVRSRSGRYRLAETTAGIVPLPASSRHARRALRRIRRPITCDPRLVTLARARRGGAPGLSRLTIVRLPDTGRPSGRPSLPARPLGLGPLVRIEQEGDVLRCSGTGCAALVPVPPPGRLIAGKPSRCPGCGHRA